MQLRTGYMISIYYHLSKSFKNLHKLKCLHNELLVLIEKWNVYCYSGGKHDA